MLNTQCNYNYQLIGLYPVILDSHCTTTGTIETVSPRTDELLQIQTIGLTLILCFMAFVIAYKMSDGKK